MRGATSAEASDPVNEKEVLRDGKHKGKTLEQVLKTDWNYIVWLRDRDQGKYNPQLKKLLRLATAYEQAKAKAEADQAAKAQEEARKQALLVAQAQAIVEAQQQAQRQAQSSGDQAHRVE